MALQAKCPRCKNTITMGACSNCGGTVFEETTFYDQPGLRCKRCLVGDTHWICPHCEAKIPSTSFSESSPCFVATTTMGTPEHKDVVVLREFRDTWLSQRRWGRLFIRVYDTIGPVFAVAVQHGKVLRRLSACLLITPSAILASGILGRHRYQTRQRRDGKTRDTSHLP